MQTEIREVSKPPEWHQFIKQHGKWQLFQSCEWGQVQEKLGHKIWRWGIYQGAILSGVAQIILVRAKRGSFLHLRHGPVLAYGKENINLWQALILRLRQLAKLERASFIRVSPLIPDTEENAHLMRSLQFRPAPVPRLDGEVCWVLDLGPSWEEMLANMRKTTRYLVRQAEKLGVSVEESWDIEAFLKLYQTTARRHSFVPHRGIREEFEVFGKAKRAILLLGQYQRRLLAGAIILLHDDMAIYHHGASIPGGIPVSYLLQWRAIQEAKRRGLKIYNFWGIAPGDSPRHPWRGLTGFKQGFGGREMSFLHTHDLPLSPLYAVSFMIEEGRKFLRGY